MKNILLGLAMVSCLFPPFANSSNARHLTPAVPDYVDDGGVPLSDEEAMSLIDDELFVPEEPSPQPEQPMPSPTPAPEQPVPNEPTPSPTPVPEEPTPQPTPGQTPQPAPTPRPLPPASRPLPARGWVCIAANRVGHRFTGRSFIPGQARRIALMSCQRGALTSRPFPRPVRGCHIVRCFRR